VASDVEDVNVIHVDNKPEAAQIKPEDIMEVEQGDDVGPATPLAEQSRRDRKLRELYMNSMLTISDKRKVSEAASIFSDSIRDRKRTREDSQPVDEDEPGTFLTHTGSVSLTLLAGPIRRRGRPPAADSQTSKKFQTVIIMVHAQISQHRNGNIFHNPIKTSEAPDYYDIVKRPMDVKTIKAHIREGQIASSAEFQRDVYLMFANSLMYNRPGSDIYTMAEEVRPFLDASPCAQLT
jgi:Bromodomain